jgi:outer membrane protein, multidrug efflux system
MLGPDYEAPQITTAEWNTPPEAVGEAQDKWWEALKDPLLSQYIAWAGEHNYTIQQAEANILQARAMRQIAASKLYPQVIADLNGTKTYFSKQGPVFAIGQAAGNSADTSSSTNALPFVLQIPQIQNLFNALFDATWELDLFGKIRRGVESAVAELEARIAQRDDALLTVYAEIARNYIDLRSFQKRARLITENIDLLQKQLLIVEASVRYGYRNQLDLEALQANLTAAQAAFPDTQSEIYRAIYTISILIGKMPEDLVDDLIEAKELPTVPEAIAVGLRSDLLRRRPDVRYAERKLAEATADIGVAVASFFPTITLAGTGGFQSLALPKLFEWGSRTWAYGADVSQPIFEGGLLVGHLHFARAEQASASASYQQTVLGALQQAESGLKAFEELRIAANDWQKNVHHNNLVVAITRERFQKGLINQIDLLRNEQQLVTSELSLLDSQTAELTALISLYKALGGGWQCEE